jgi:hypothetical protein
MLSLRLSLGFQNGIFPTSLPILSVEQQNLNHGIFRQQYSYISNVLTVVQHLYECSIFTSNASCAVHQQTS